MRLTVRLGLAASAWLTLAVGVLAEDLTVTTYYPSPRGVYEELRTSGDVKIGDSSSTTPQGRLEIRGSTAASAAKALYVGNLSGAPRLVVEDGGNVGIGTATPAGPLHVRGPNDTASIVALMPGADTAAAGTPSLNVGIGTASPSTELEVAGQVKITGGNPGTGKVLTSSDAAGLAAWQPPGGLPQGVQVFTTPGTSTFIVPGGITRLFVEVYGGGGGGAGGSNGGNGGPSSFAGISASGGTGGINTGSPGNGGSGSGGDINQKGGGGQSGTGAGSFSGMGGSNTRGGGGSAACGSGGPFGGGGGGCGTDKGGGGAGGVAMGFVTVTPGASIPVAVGAGGSAGGSGGGDGGVIIWW